MYVSHMRPPYGTSIYDVEDPRRPRLLASLEVPIGWHSHKVRVRDGLMIVNYESSAAAPTISAAGWASTTSAGRTVRA